MIGERIYAASRRVHFAVVAGGRLIYFPSVRAAAKLNLGICLRARRTTRDEIIGHRLSRPARRGGVVLSKMSDCENESGRVALSDILQICGRAGHSN